MKSKLVLLFVLINFYLSHAQDKPQFEPTYYKDTISGKLFWNMSLPAYLTLSPTPNPSSGVQLESKATRQYADPFYFDTEGINYIRTRWAVDKKTGQSVPNVEIVWEIYADGHSPHSLVHLIDPNKHYSGHNLYCSKALRLAISSRDALSGVKQIYYSVNGAQYKTYTDTLTFDREGIYEIKYFAVDNVNNVEQTHDISFYLDFTPPKSNAMITGIHLDKENIISTSTKIILRSKDTISGVKQIYYRIDSTKWIAYQPNTSIPLAGLTDGNHILEFYAVDNVNNKESIQTFKFYLDKTAPITIADILGDKFIVNDKVFFSGRTKLKLTSVDNKAGVKAVFYSIDGGEFKKYTEPIYLPSTPGWHEVVYFAVDSTENITKDKLTNSYYKYRMKVDKIYMDLSGPKLSYTIQGDKYKRSDTIFISPRTKIILNASDPESGVKSISYYLDNSKTEHPYERPFTLADINHGLHKVNIIGYDNVNNRNIATFTIFLDKEPPKITYSFDIPPIGQKDSLPVYTQNTKLFLSFIDDFTGTSTIFYSLNGGQKIPYSNYITGFKTGENTINVEVTDKVGNKAIKTISFFIK